MFKEEILRNFRGLKITWYPKEKICMVFSKKSVRTYNKIPKKYKILFENTQNKSRSPVNFLKKGGKKCK